MLDTFLATISPMLVMFTCILVGFLLKKGKLVPDNAATVLSKLEIYVLLPAQIVSTFFRYCTVATLSQQYKLIIYGCIAIGLSAVMGFALAPMFSKHRDERGIYRYSLIIANAGFLGNAIVSQILGPEALYGYMLLCMPNNVFLYGWAINSLIPRGKGEGKSLWKRLLNPTLIALVSGISLGLLGIGNVLPDFAWSVLDKLAGCMGPIAMVLTGIVIGGYRIRSLMKIKRVYIASFLRLLILPGIIVAVLVLLGADRNTALFAMFAYGSALGLNTVVIPAAYDGDTQTGASMAMISHAGAVLTIPLLYAVLTKIL